MKTSLIPFLQRIEGWRLWLLTVIVCTVFAVIVDSALSLLLRGEIQAVSLLIALIAGVLIAAPAAAIFTFLLNTLTKFREQTLRDSVQRAESRLGMALEATNLLFWEFDLISGKLSYDDKMLSLLNMDEADAPHNLQSWLERVHPDDIPVFMKHFQAALSAQGDSHFDFAYRIAQRSQSWGWLHSSGRVIRRNAAGVAELAVGTTLDITARKLAETELREAKERFELIFNSSPNVMLISRLPDGRITHVNDAFTRDSGYSKAEAIGNTTLGLNLWTTRADREKMTQQLQTTGSCKDLEVEFQVKDGSRGIGLLSAVITNLDGIPHIVSTLQDITEKKKFDSLVWNQANYDSLTGLPNRRMFGDRLAQDLKKAHRADLQLALLFIDLDHFKEVNDTLGHDMGDMLLVEAARRITSCVRESDTVARLGGDEFTVILAELEETLSVERVAENLIQILTLPYPLGSEVAYISASIGITLYPDDATDMKDLIQNADQAMYVSKHFGRNRYSYFTPATQQDTQRRQQTREELRLALQAGQFRLFYQPIVELASGRIQKAEALIRWQHPQLGILSPAEFIPLAEDLGMIHAITDWLFQESLRQVKQWQMVSGEDFQISMNISSLQFQSQQDTSAWLDALKTTGVAGRSLIFEIRDSVLLAPASHVAAQLCAFHEAGIQVVLEGYTSGSSALTYLKKFAVDYLKITAAFTRNLTTDSSDIILTETLTTMGHNLGLQIIAMGVETLQQRDLLIAAGCDYGQGYLYSRPVPADGFEILLKNNMQALQDAPSSASNTNHALFPPTPLAG